MILFVDQRKNDASCQRIERTHVEIAIPLIPLRERRRDGDDVAGLGPRADFENQLARARQLLIRECELAGGEPRAVGDEDPEVKRLERSGRDGDGGCKREPAVQTLISLTFPSTLSFGSVIACTSSTLTPGAISISFSPCSVTSSTQ